MTSPFLTQPLAVTVRQCRVCRGIYSWPILDMTDVLAYSYLHCGKPTEYIETRATDREPICCDGDSDVGTAG